MNATSNKTNTYRKMTAVLRAFRAGAVMFAAMFLWTACNSADTTTPLLERPEPVSGPTVTHVQISDIFAPDTLRPGSVFLVTGSGFATAPNLGITLAGYNLAHIVVSDKQIKVQVPQAPALPCMGTGSQNLRFSVGSEIVTASVVLSTAARLELRPGQSVNFLEAGSAGCTEFVAPKDDSANYAIAVLNTERSASSSTSFQVRASAAGAMLQDESPNNNADSHSDHIARENSRIDASANLSEIWSSQKTTNSAHASFSKALVVGQIVARNAVYSSCALPTRIMARVVYVGSKSVVLEDVAAPRAGEADEYLRAMGEEFDNVVYPMLKSSMGDPLALNSAMGGDSRVTMLFTPYVNDSASGSSGFVTTCNLFPSTVYSSSNEDEILYARSANATETLRGWHRGIRSTIIHEAKHLASFAERLVRGNSLEEPWLEEATARIAEELYARSFAGIKGLGSNTGWSESVRCEIYQCDNRPIAMWKHIPALHDYFVGAGSLTPLGGVSASDNTYYGSGWSLVRWAIDHYAVDENSFLRALTVGGPGSGTGIDALARQTGRSPEEMLAEWSLAVLLDDVEGFEPERKTLSFPSWNLPELMAGLAEFQGGRFSANPHQVRVLNGETRFIVPQLRAFSTTFLEARLGAGDSHILELQGANGNKVPSAIRISVVRVR